MMDIDSFKRKLFLLAPTLVIEFKIFMHRKRSRSFIYIFFIIFFLL